MKKLLLSAFAAICACAVQAQDNPVPFQSHAAVLTNVSSNGNYAVGSSDGIGYFVNVKTGKLKTFTGVEMTYDMNAVSDCGIAVGSYTPEYLNQTPCYITEDKGYVPLPVLDNDALGNCRGVSSDASIVAGHVKSIGSECYKPVIWYRNASGEYDMYEELPCDTLGYDNRVNQGVHVLGISGDGLKIFGRVIDYSGFVYYPVIWERNSVQTHDWTYRILCTDYNRNKDQERPKWPEYMPTEPEVTEYLTEEELEAFNKALEIYNDSVAKASWTIPAEEREPYPTYNPKEHISDFIDLTTSDGVERYNKYIGDCNIYIEETQAYNDSVALYNERYDKYFILDKMFVIYNMSLSSNGKYMVTKTANNTVIIDPETEEVSVIEESDGLYPTAVLDDGTVFLGQPAAMPPLDRIPYVYSNGTLMSFGDWVRERSQKAYDDLMENFPDGHFGVVNSNNPEGRTFGGFNQGFDYGYKGWVMNLDAYDDFTTGITEGETAAADVEVSVVGGAIEIAGAVNADVRVYTVGGSCVYTAAGVDGNLTIGTLPGGAYIVYVKSGAQALSRKVVVE